VWWNFIHGQRVFFQTAFSDWAKCSIGAQATGRKEMEQFAAILLLVACPVDTSACRETSAPQPLFESVEACQRERLSQALISIDGRQILSKCLPVNPDAIFEDAEIVWDVTNDRELTAEVRLLPDLAGLQTS
jgi:hypothetical protein